MWESKTVMQQASHTTLNESAWQFEFLEQFLPMFSFKSCLSPSSQKPFGGPQGSASIGSCHVLKLEVIPPAPIRASLESYLSQLMRLWYLSYRRPAKAQASLRIRAVSPEPSLFAYIKYGSTCRRMVRLKIRQKTYWMAAHARLKNEFTEDEKCHNLVAHLREATFFLRRKAHGEQ